ncbi:DNA-binding transcriptional regulator PaaX [Caldicoprobacter guelmensis]|uniref:Chromate resistance protein ChrB n=1 Tax=Caldicoprobacter guelmensis TaxID=1170224 RepID=UPI00195B11D9|nr:Chromate resistance protein ChrB [Caldicoprobacter guelmensis]MBM7582233.1 DNA-binding transcriptional regulator PaaX [Caldicoprobacter guelmensis]
MSSREWLILNFTLPKEQSRVRVSVWRKLKKCGSVSIGQSMWVLPASEEHLKLFNEMAKEIIENGGIAYIANADFLSTGNTDDIINLFNKARDEEYQEFLEKCEDFFLEIEKETRRENFTYIELEENEAEYNKLVEWLKKINSRDFFGAPLKKQAEEMLEKCKRLLDDFSNKVYALNEGE